MDESPIKLQARETSPPEQVYDDGREDEIEAENQRALALLAEDHMAQNTEITDNQNGTETISKQSGKEKARSPTPDRPKKIIENAIVRPLNKDKNKIPPPHRTEWDRGDHRAPMITERRRTQTLPPRSTYRSRSGRSKWANKISEWDKKWSHREQPSSAHKDQKGPTQQDKPQRGDKRQQRSRSRSKRRSVSRKKRSRSRRSVSRKKRSSSRRRSRSESTDPGDRQNTQKLTKRLMEENTARSRFKEFQEQQYRDVARIFVNAGYATLTSVKEMQEKARDFLMQDIRKGNKTGRTPKELRLIIEIFDTYPAPTLLKGTAEHPRFDEIEIPLKMAKWKWSMNNLTGMLAPDQEMTNFFSSEFAKAKLKRPPYIPFVIPDLKEQPWRPFYPAHTRAFENWQKLNSSHKKPTPMDTSFQAWTLYNMRFIISGELTGAWRTFGGISAQWSHFGLILNMAVVENATIAMAYEKNFRLEAAHLARMRADEIDWVKYLSTEDEIIKRMFSGT